jgi:hypothetical protein
VKDFLHERYEASQKGRAAKNFQQDRNKSRDSHLFSPFLNKKMGTKVRIIGNPCSQEMSSCTPC